MPISVSAMFAFQTLRKFQIFSEFFRGNGNRNIRSSALQKYFKNASSFCYTRLPVGRLSGEAKYSNRSCYENLQLSRLRFKRRTVVASNYFVNCATIIRFVVSSTYKTETNRRRIARLAWTNNSSKTDLIESLF